MQTFPITPNGMANYYKIVSVQVEFNNCKGRGEPCMKIS